MTKPKPIELSASTLKAALWDTLQQVKTGAVTPSVANAVASQSRMILSVVATEIRLETNKSVSKKTKKFLA